jgi:hypothetical protein
MLRSSSPTSYGEDTDLALIGDKNTAIANILLNNIFGPVQTGTVAERIQSQIATIREERHKKYGQGPFLCIIITGETPDLTPETSREEGGMVVGFGPTPRPALKAEHTETIVRIINSIALNLESLLGIKKSDESIAFFRDDGTPLYIYHFTGSGEGYMSRAIEFDSLAAVEQSFMRLSKESDLSRVINLLVASLENDGDNLRSFLNGWSALEIFINKVFASYEERIAQELQSITGQSIWREYLGRTRTTMKDKYRLNDKFALIALQLSPETADKDHEEFLKIKKMRDKLLHGERIADSSLPVQIVQQLSRKYMRLHLTPER